MSESSHRALLVRALAGVPAAEPQTAARQAAIAVVLLQISDALEVLLIERAVRAGDPWSGHMALPGGHVDPTDVDLAATAERETLEEVGLDLKARGERLGQLSDLAPVRAVPIAVRPFVYLLEERPELTLSAEVEAALWVPVAPLRAGEHRSSFTLSRSGPGAGHSEGQTQSLEFPAWDLDGRVVWGLTYRVLSELFSRMNALSGPE